MKTIFLVGYMGCGKSSLGCALAEHLGCGFIDLDDYIEQQTQQTIPSLFETRGEEAFRLLERGCLAELAGRQNIVVATGGGAACYSDNISLMNREGITIYLKVEPSELMRRLSVPKHQAKRPLISALSPDELRVKITSMLSLREPYYSQARFTVLCDDAPKQQTLQKIIQALESLPAEE